MVKLVRKKKSHFIVDECNKISSAFQEFPSVNHLFLQNLE